MIHDFSRMTQIYGCFIFLILYSGCFDVSIGISVQLSPYVKESNSLCKTGFLHGLDRYLYNGSLNTTSQDLSRRQVVYFEMQSSLLNGYTTVCKVNIYPSCDSNQALGCFCENTSGSSLELFLNLTADIQYSNGTIRIRWPKFGESDESNVERVPVIYGEPTENLTINNNAVNLEQCSIQLETTNFVKWCVTGLSSHNLISNISFASSDTDCLSFTFTSYETENTSTPIHFSLQYSELQDCNRAKTRVCYFYINSITLVT